MPETLTATVDAPNARVQLQLVWDTLPTVNSATISRVNSDGTIEPVRSGDPAQLIGGQWIDYDHEAEFDAAVYYQATSTDRPGETIASGLVTVPSNDLTWLKHPGDPSLNRVVEVIRPPDLTRDIDAGIFPVLGRSRPIAISVIRHASVGELLLRTVTDPERLGLLDLLEPGAPLLLASPGDTGVGRRYIAVGAVQEHRVSVLAAETEREWTLPYAVVDRPYGPVLAAGNSWSDVLGEYASWQAMMQAEGTWNDVLAGVGQNEPGAP